MRDRMERLVLLPFTIGCVSEASVALGVHQSRGTRPHCTNTNSSSPRTKEEDEESSSSTEIMKINSLKFSKPNVSTGFHRLVKGFKNFSQLFAYKEEIEEMYLEMEIGQPTDVKHVTHIGWDASSDSNPIQGWDNLVSPELISLLPSATTPPQFGQLAMAPQANNNSPLV